ncbi:axin-1-like [Sinocyclocheilus anshuiensis]|uniref:axin-1-like n=1 Tax=Sinocyclocheilus anshuiensis TaxID=1608454 RepID=UPI0007BAABC6|nr:PREDICTED: axin-1-like [Sinocyclocheilus anshuiensis]
MSCRGDVGGVFSEDAPRPPVPGEEGSEGGVYSNKTASHWSEAPVAAVRRSDANLGFEPEGSVSPDGPYEPWAETLLTLLEDRDGTALFLRFLRTLGCAALLEFWFACSGFQKVPEDAMERRLKLAKAMYRCYLCDGVVSRRITAETRCGIRDGIQQLRLDSALFVQAHAQVQAVLQDSLFPLFLRSEVYLKHTQTADPSPETRFSGYQTTASQGEESEKETLPPHNTANQKRPGNKECRQRRHACHRHHRTRERDTRHTHLPHTPGKMTPHTFAAELMRRLQELQTQTQTQSPPALRHTEEETDTSATTAFASCHSLKMLDSDCDTQREISTRPDTRDVTVKSIVTSPAHTHQCVTVVYCYDGDVIPYRSCVQGVSVVTLGLFRSLLTRRGPFRFFFKRASAEFACGAVYEEIREDEAVLPTFDQKIIARVERITQ